MPPAAKAAAPRTAADILISLAEGVRFVARTPLIALCVFAVGVVSGVAMNFNVIIPPLARLTLQIGAPGLGALMAAVGLGSLTGALTVAVLREPRRLMIVVGGVIPPGAFDELYEAGATAIFPPGMHHALTSPEVSTLISHFQPSASLRNAGVCLISLSAIVLTRSY